MRARCIFLALIFVTEVSLEIFSSADLLHTYKDSERYFPWGAMNEK
jgi:hypothetical protein